MVAEFQIILRRKYYLTFQIIEITQTSEVIVFPRI